MTYRTGSRTGRLVALVACGITLLLGPGSPTGPQPAAAAPATATAATGAAAAVPGAPGAPVPDGPATTRFELAALTPAVMTPTATLTLTGTLWAGDDAPVPAGSVVQLRLQRSVLSTREAVAGWVDPSQPAVGSLLTSQRLATELPAGASLPVTFTLPAASLRLADSADAWGPRGLSVTVRDPSQTVYLATARTHLTWFPGSTVPRPTRISVVVPVTGTTPQPGSGLTDAKALTEQTTGGGRLDSVLEAAAVPGATMALDPSVLTAGPADDSGSAPSPTTGSGDSTTDPVEEWRERVRGVAADHDVLMLPYGDPDLAALAHAGRREIARLSEELGRSTTQRLLGENARTDIAWVPGGDVDPATLALLVDLGRRAVVLDDTAQPPIDPPRDTVGAHTTVEGASTPVDGLVDDGPLSAALAQVGADRDPDAGVRGVARLVAETAAIALERPGAERHLLVTAPRDWNPDPEQGVAAVTALTTSPWVEAGTLQQLLDTPVGGEERAAVDLTPEQRAAELPAGALADVGATLEGISEIAVALDDPTQRVESAQTGSVALASASWRADLDGWRDAVDAYRARLTSLHGAVHVVPGSTVTQVSRNVELPVTVENTLDQPVTVVVDVQPESNRLVVTRQITATLPAQDLTTVRVPVRGVGNGDTSVRIQLLTEDGVSLGEPVRTRVLVRADWETRGTFTLAGVAALVLIVGLVRTFRRGPRRRGRDPINAGRAGGTEAGATVPPVDRTGQP